MVYKIVVVTSRHSAEIGERLFRIEGRHIPPHSDGIVIEEVPDHGTMMPYAYKVRIVPSRGKLTNRRKP